MYFKKRKVTQNKLIFREVWVSLQNDQCLFSKYWDDFFGLFVFPLVLFLPSSFYTKTKGRHLKCETCEVRFSQPASTAFSLASSRVSTPFSWFASPSLSNSLVWKNLISYFFFSSHKLFVWCLKKKEKKRKISPPIVSQHQSLNW